MTFIKKLEAHMQGMAERCYKTIGTPSYRRSDSVITMHLRPASQDPAYIYCPSFLGANKSNHQKVAEAVLTERLKRDMLDLRNIIAEGIPALDHDNLSYEMELRDSSKSGLPRFKFELCGHQFASSAVTLATIIKRFSALERHTKNVPCSSEKTFSVNNRTIKARDAYDAVRIYMALSSPYTLDENPPTHPSIKVMEILDPGPYCRALFTPSS